MKLKSTPSSPSSANRVFQKKASKQNKMTEKILSDEDKEDIVLVKLMEETNLDERIDINDFLKKLRN